MNDPFQVRIFRASDELVEDAGVIWSRLVTSGRS